MNVNRLGYTQNFILNMLKELECIFSLKPEHVRINILYSYIIYYIHIC